MQANQACLQSSIGMNLFKRDAALLYFEEQPPREHWKAL
jgi:hypothetical protein